MINRVTFSNVAVEITRRCNYRCAHCCRGDAQDLDMSQDIIDAFLDRTQGIYDLHITGGEPFLNLDGLRYFLEAARKRNVLIGRVFIVTNGSVQSQEVVDLLHYFSDYISMFIKPDIPKSSLIRIAISKDRFHAEFGDSEKAYNWYQGHLSDYAIISMGGLGAIPKKRGRAVNLNYAVETERIEQTKIEYKTANRESLCLYRKKYELLHPNQIIILCGLCLTVNGSLVPLQDDSYDNEDNPNNTVSSVFVKSARELLNNIDIFNEGKPSCVISNKRSENQSEKEKSIWDVIMVVHDMLERRKNAPDQDYLNDLTFHHIAALAANNVPLSPLTIPFIMYLYGFDGNKFKELGEEGLKKRILESLTLSESEVDEYKKLFPEWYNKNSLELSELPSSDEMESLYAEATQASIDGQLYESAKKRVRICECLCESDSDKYEDMLKKAKDDLKDAENRIYVKYGVRVEDVFKTE